MAAIKIAALQCEKLRKDLSNVVVRFSKALKLGGYARPVP